MDITFVTSTRNDDEARELLRAFGMPFRDSVTTPWTRGRRASHAEDLKNAMAVTAKQLDSSGS